MGRHIPHTQMARPGKRFSPCPFLNRMLPPPPRPLPSLAIHPRLSRPTPPTHNPALTPHHPLPRCPPPSMAYIPISRAARPPRYIPRRANLANLSQQRHRSAPASGPISRRPNPNSNSRAPHFFPSTSPQRTTTRRTWSA